MADGESGLDAIVGVVRQLLLTRLLLSADQLESDLVEDGIIDSADFMDLFLLLEETFGIVIAAEDLILENFRSADQISGFVARKLAEGADPAVAQGPGRHDS
ncbi:MAG: acyl carrier protein [Caulobacteraceae bacterium]|nr:acyl carrier protein [Caulobacteraceae bacterium]